MSDLSKVLGDLYGSTDPDGPPVKREPGAEARIPGQAEGALETETLTPGEDLQSVLDDALAKLPAQEMTPVEAAEEWAEGLAEDNHHLHQRGALRAWVRTDDDFLPERGRKFNKRK